MTGTHGHPDQPTTAVQRADRARRIAETKAAGATWPDVAARFGVSEKTARRAAKAHVEGASRLAQEQQSVAVLSADPLSVEPADALRAALETYGWAEGALRALAAEADNSSARVGAIRQAVLVAEKRIDLLVTAGVIPSPDSALLTRVGEAQRCFAVLVLDALERYGLSLDDIDPKLLAAAGPEGVAA